MAKISSKYQRIFCGGIDANINIAQFGSFKAGSPVYSTDPEIIQNLSAWTEGWSGAVVNNNAPTIQDMNALFYLFTRQIAYLLERGVGERENNTTYYEGSLIQDGIGNLFKSVTGENVGNTIFDDENWVMFKSLNSREVSGDEPLLNNDYSFVWPTGVTAPTMPANYYPDAAPKLKGRKHMQTIFGSGVVQSIEIFCTGDKWILIQAGVET